jgi:hypothetical protein
MLIFGGAADNDVRSNDTWALSLSDTPTWTELFPAGTRPSGRTGHSAVYDPVRDRMIVFGGIGDTSLNDTWALSLSGTPTWTEVSPAGSPPSARRGHTAVYDTVRDRMLIFGAGSPFSRNETWALSLSGSPTWTEVSPAGTPPIGRLYHAAIYDPVHDRMLVFGGWEVPARLNDIWVLSLGGVPTWMELTPEGISPSERMHHTAIYDPGRERVLVFGGTDDKAYRNDTWMLSLGDAPTWAEVAPAIAPKATGGHTAIYDPKRERMIVFGGGERPLNEGHVRNDTWVLSLGETPTWTELSPAGTLPSARNFHSAIYDPLRDRMIVFGGWNDIFPYFNDTWALSLAGPPTWTELSPAGTPPSARIEHSAIYDPVRDRMIVFGGGKIGALRNDTWALSLGGLPTWTELSPAGTPPTPRASPAIYDPVRERMVVFGGHLSGTVRSNDTWALSLGGLLTWTELSPAGTPPPRAAHTAIYDPVRDRMLVFGGILNSGGRRNDTWALSLADTPTWTESLLGGSPPIERISHPAIYDPARDRMLVFGGSTLQQHLNDVWELSFDEMTPVTLRDVVTEVRRGYVRLAWTAFLDTPMKMLVLRSDEPSSGYIPVSEEIDGDVGMSEFTYRDTAVQTSTAYYYKIGYRETNIWSYSAPIHVVTLAADFSVFGLTPNPSRPGTKMRLVFELSRPGRAVLDIYNVVGKRVHSVADANFKAGVNRVDWDGRRPDGTLLPAGVYFAKLTSNGQGSSRKFVLVR